MVKYLRDHIKEEIGGAKEYFTKAVEMKAKNPEWAMKFYKMGETEIDHATCLTKMLDKTKKPETMTDLEYSEVQKSVINEYVTSMGEIDSLKKLYHLG
jgi:hypothetical protein